MALYDWNRENKWSCENSFIESFDDRGYIFYTFTKKTPKHCTIRHLFVLEEFRQQGVGSKLIDCAMQKMQQHNVSIFRFFVNKPAITFYKNLGFEFIGESKTGLPFVYCNAITRESIMDPKQLKKLKGTSL